MPDLLLELFSEEIPARMQVRAAADLRTLVTDALVEAGFLYEGAVAHATPRRLVLAVAGLPAKGRDVREERKGPRLTAPDAAIQGFLKSTGLSIDQLSVQSDPKKGDSYVALIEKPGRPTAEFLAEILPGIIRAFPWPKSMRSGPASRQPGSLRWVRPLHSVLATFGADTETPEIVPFSVDGIASGDTTRGHRFMAPGEITVRRFEDYEAALLSNKVVLSAERRAEIIRHDARDLAFAQGLEVVEDEGLLAEVAGLVEWPVVLMGTFDEAFLAIPPEVIRATIRANQKCFVLRKQGGEALANKFVLVSNIDASDGGATIVAGNERVVRARLSDAKFFWETDLKPLPDHPDDKPLDGRLKKLESLGIVFHEKLGTQAERIERIAALARDLAPAVGADPTLAERAARLAKADLVTEMVGEFPELQGLMGRYYAAAQGEHSSVAAAIEDHYRPLGPSDRVPTDPVAIAVALADKLDTLVGFWAIDEKPTGSKDPFALRRAALGVIRLVLENGVRLELVRVMAKPGHDVGDDLLAFFHDRLKVYLRERGARHDLIDAVLASGNTQPRHAEERPQGASRSTQDVRASFETQVSPAPQDDEGGSEASASNDDLLTVVRRVDALGRFLDTEDGRNLLAGTRRAANILRIEEKKDGRAYDGAPDLSRIVFDEERALATALGQAQEIATRAIAAEDWEGAMRALATLRPAVDAFFDKVTVNDDDPALRENRLRLLSRLRQATRTVADFTNIEG